MPRRENQKQKLLRILEIMFAETDETHGITVNELISRLDEYGIASERKSIYNDFETLSELGFSISQLQTRPPRYKLDYKIFELWELKMLVDAVQSSKFITAGKSREIIEKLGIFAGSHQKRELSRQVYVEDRLKTDNKSSIYSIDAIHNAINHRRKLTFKYFDYNYKKERVFRHDGAVYTVDPCALMWDDEKYYLVAYDECAGKIKNFRVDKMQGVFCTEERRLAIEEIERFDPSLYGQRIFGMYGGREDIVTIECRESLAGVMIDRFGHDLLFTKTDFGFKFTLRVMVSPTFFGWLLGFGADIRILSPEPVREELLSRIKDIEKLYE